MKKFIKAIFSVLLVLFVLAIIFCVIDVLRIHNDENPMFTFSEKVVDGEGYVAKIYTGLGYKMIRYTAGNNPEKIKIGTILMSEKMQDYIDKVDITPNPQENVVMIPTESGENGESGEKIVKITTFGEKYTDTISLEGMEEEVYAQDIHSKLGYSMKYYFELFDYSGFDDHDKYTWELTSGDVKSVMTIYDISDEEAYKESLENLSKKDLFEEISGDEAGNIQKVYYRSFEEKEVRRINYIYIIWLDNLKLMVDFYLPQEAAEGIGVYMDQMMRTIQ